MKRHKTNHYGSCLPLAFVLRRFVVDADTQFMAIFHLQHNPGFSHGSAKIFIGLKGKRDSKGDSYTTSLACLYSSVPFLFTYSSHTLKACMIEKKVTFNVMSSSLDIDG